MTDRTTTTDPADVAELLRWVRESRPTMGETSAAYVRRLEAENEQLRERLREHAEHHRKHVLQLSAIADERFTEAARLRARIADLEQQILVALGEARR